MPKLVALDRYLELLGIDNGDWKKLPKKLPPKERVSKGPPADALKKRINPKRTSKILASESGWCISQHH